MLGKGLGRVLAVLGVRARLSGARILASWSSGERLAVAASGEGDRGGLRLFEGAALAEHRLE
jgi:hypothetical protein